MPDQANTIHFLLVEDDDDHAELITLALKRSRMSCQIDRVGDGEQALALLRNEHPFQDAIRPDLILLDLNMPRMNGHEVIEIVKKDAALSMIPIIVLTTSNAEADKVRAYQSHANSYLIKPLNFDQFQGLADKLSEYWTELNKTPL